MQLWVADGEEEPQNLYLKDRAYWGPDTSSNVS